VARDGARISITNFGDRVTIGGHAYVAIYSRVQVSNPTGSRSASTRSPRPGSSRSVPRRTPCPRTAPPITTMWWPGTGSAPATRGRRPARWPGRAASASTSRTCAPTGTGSWPGLRLIDTTYDYGFGRLAGKLPPNTFGGYPTQYYCTAYNAGYGEWGLANVPTTGGHHLGLTIRSSGTSVTLTVSGQPPAGPVLFQLPAFVGNIASAGTVHESTGTVTLPAATRTVTVQLKQAAG
jgi:hypothetical protein